MTNTRRNGYWQTGDCPNGEVAYQIFYTEDALEDLQAVLDYILFDNPKAAERFGTARLNHVNLLKAFPRMGAPVPKRPEVAPQPNQCLLPN